ncbi:unnamed protein product [Cochlearia groenlandica]
MLTSSSILSNQPIIPNSFETLTDSSSPIASIGADIVQSLAISSPERDQDTDSASYSPSIETLIVQSPDGEADESRAVVPETQIQGVEDIDEDIWDACSPRRGGVDVSPGYGSDEDGSDFECSQPLFIFKQEEPLLMIQEEAPSHVGAGLWNLGNTCFINSVLQCFTHTVSLIESLRAYNDQESCYCNAGFCVMRALRYHIECALKPARYPISPYYFLDNINYISPEFQPYRQEDAHEFLQAFLDKLERCCVDRRSDYISSQDVNIVDQVFSGRLVSRLRCCNCDSVSERFEPTLGLSLEIEDVDDLGSALESFTRVEKLDEQLTCDNCKEKVSKEKQLLLDKLPLVATFHLKRFKNNGYYMEKVFKHVKIPLELDLQPYMNGGEESEVPIKYHLYALVEHLGLSLAYGHYSSYVRSAPKTWHHFDDSKVTRIDEDSVLSHDSYILFYAREGTPWFSNALEEMQPSPEASLLNSSSPTSVLNPTSDSGTSYENIEKSDKPFDSAHGVSNPHVKTEDNFGWISYNANEDVILSAGESSGEDSLMTELLYNSCTEKEVDSCIATERANTDDEFVPLLEIENQDSSPKKQEGSLENRDEDVETTETQEEEEEEEEEPASAQTLVASDVVETMESGFVSHGEMMKKLSPRRREMQQAIYKIASPPKKLKTS